jgi:hypothetical protein
VLTKVLAIMNKSDDGDIEPAPEEDAASVN